MFKSKNYVDSQKLIESGKQYEIDEACKLVCETAKAKFDETIELHVKLGVDPRHADQQVRGVCVLPNGTGKTVRVLVIAKGAKADEATGLMPNPKSGTVTMDITKALHDIKAGKVEYRVDKTSIVHVPVGKKSFGPEKLAENLNTVMEALVKAKPAAAKGTYLRSIYLASTMGPSIKVNYKQN